MVSFYWFDYETFGTHPAWDRPCQFAGVRTDEALNVIGEPLVLYCRQAADYLPQPGACRVTGITPQLANEQGVIEAEFIERIVAEIGRAGTCSAGYNSIRFDDEFTRHTLFRNLQDPYEYEWRDGNSRWDLIDVVRLTRALRPEGINWPFNEDGSPSNRLEHLSVANGIEHAQAHDAMSDVWATIGMARLIRQHQPKLFTHVFTHRGKAAVSQILNTKDRKPCLQVSGMIPGSRHNLAAILPLTRHPDNQNGVIVLDLKDDPRYLLDLPAEEIARRLFQSPANKAQSETATAAGEPADTAGHSGHRPATAPARPGLRTVHINKCPVIVPMATLRAQDAERLDIDLQQVQQHARWASEICTDETLQQIRLAMTRSWADEPVPDVDGTLYSGSFLSQSDRQRLQLIRQLPVDRLAAELGNHTGHFDDRRLDEMVWRYQARNFPETLDAEQQARWADQCRNRLADCTGGWLCLNDYLAAIDAIDWSTGDASLKTALEDYGRQFST